MVFDDLGTGWQANIDGLPPFRYPPQAFAEGRLSGTSLSPISPSEDPCA